MNKVSVAGLGVLGAVAVALALSVPASAEDDVVGQTYAKARAALSAKGMDAIVATSIGGRKALDDCIVTSARVASAVDGYGTHRAGSTLVNLDCAGT